MGQPRTGRGQTFSGLARNDRFTVKRPRAGQSGSAPTAIIVVVVVATVALRVLQISGPRLVAAALRAKHGNVRAYADRQFFGFC